MAENKRIPELTELTELDEINDLIPIYDASGDVTAFVRASVLKGGQNHEFPWDAEIPYDEGIVVTHGSPQKKIWESLHDNNLGNVPTEGAHWTEVSPSESSGAKKWTPGIYGFGYITVDYEEDTYFLDLPDDANNRPFNSSNFDTERAAGIWKPVSMRKITGAAVGGNIPIIVSNGELQDSGKSLNDIGSGVFEPVQDITALKAIDTTDAGDYPDKWMILVEDEGQWYRLDRDSAVSESLPRIVAPTTGVGRWIRDQDTQLAAKADKVNAEILESIIEVQAGTPNTLTLDFQNYKQLDAISRNAVAADFTVALSNDSVARIVSYALVTSGTVVITFPAAFVSDDSRWDDSNNQLTLEAGTYELSAKWLNFSSGLWSLKCTEALV